MPQGLRVRVPLCALFSEETVVKIIVKIKNPGFYPGFLFYIEQNLLGVPKNKNGTALSESEPVRRQPVSTANPARKKIPSAILPETGFPVAHDVPKNNGKI